MATSKVLLAQSGAGAVNRRVEMDSRKDPDRYPAMALRDPADAVEDSWLDRALEDSFPASDPIAPHVFS